MITYDALVRFARTIKGETLETSARHSRFVVEVDKNGLAYHLESGNRRTDHKSTIEKVLARFNETKSYKPRDYSDISLTSSYIVRLLEMLTSGKDSA